jgi:O-antigen/teichoic acid export membrane protein
MSSPVGVSRVLTEAGDQVDPATVVDTRPPECRLRTHFSLPLYKSAYSLVINSGLTSLLGVAYWAVAAHRYPTVEIGRASAEISAMVLLSGFAQLNLQAAFPRLVPGAGASTRRLILHGYLATGLASLAAGLVFVVGARTFGWGGNFLTGTWLVSAWFVVAVITWTVFTLQDSVLAGLRQAIYVPFENTSFAIGKIGLVIVLATVSVRFGLFASWTIPTAISLIPINWLIFRRLVPRHAKAASGRAQPFSRAQLLTYVAGEYVGGMFSTVSLTVVPLLVASTLGLKAAGFFYTAWVVGTSFDLMLSQIGTSLTVEGSHDESQVASVARRAARFGMCLIVPAVVVCVLGAHPVLSLLGAPYAQHGTTILRLIALAVFPRAVTIFFLSIARVQRQARTLAVVQGALCSLVLAFAWLGLRWWGLDGAGYGYLAAQIVIAAALLPRTVRLLRASPVDVEQ